MHRQKQMGKALHQEFKGRHTKGGEKKLQILSGLWQADCKGKVRIALRRAGKGCSQREGDGWGEDEHRWQNNYSRDVLCSLEFQVLDRFLSRGFDQAVCPQHRQISASAR